MDQFTHRIIGFGVHSGDVDGVALCRMFNTAISTRGAPKYLSSDNDPLFQYHQWQANLRILDIDELKSIPYPPLRIVRFSRATLEAGVEEHQIEGVSVHVYSPAKTVADCFKYRNKIGLDVAIEALRECRRARRCTMDDLWHYAEICRVRNVMRPYLESLAT